MPERAPLAPLGASLAHRDAQAASRPRPATGPARKPAPPSSSSPTKQIANGDITPVFAAMLVCSNIQTVLTLRLSGEVLTDILCDHAEG